MCSHPCLGRQHPDLNTCLTFLPTGPVSGAGWWLASHSFCYLQNHDKQFLAVPHAPAFLAATAVCDPKADLQLWVASRPGSFLNHARRDGTLIPCHWQGVLGKEVKKAVGSLSLHHRTQAWIPYLFLCLSCVLPGRSVANLPVPCDPTGFWQENIYCDFILSRDLF